MNKSQTIHKAADALNETLVLHDALPIISIGYTFEMKNGKPDLRNGKPVVSVTDGITPELVNTVLYKALQITNKEVVKKAKKGPLNDTNTKN